MECSQETLKHLVYPYYVNQPRLIDLSAVLLGGYTSYEEIGFQNDFIKHQDAKGKVNASNRLFSLFNIGAEAALDIERDDHESTKRTIQKVQTAASLLSAVLAELRTRKLIHSLDDAKPGFLVDFEFEPRINSAKAVIDELIQLQSLSEKLQNTGNNSGGKSKGSKTKNNLDMMASSIRELFDAEEIVGDLSDCAVVGLIDDTNLYLSRRDDVLDKQLRCFATLKQIYPEGTTLLKNSIFSRIGSRELKAEFCNALKQFAEEGFYEFNSSIIMEITDKPVYEVDIIAMYQIASPE